MRRQRKIDQELFGGAAFGSGPGRSWADAWRGLRRLAAPPAGPWICLRLPESAVTPGPAASGIFRLRLAPAPDRRGRIGRVPDFAAGQHAWLRFPGLGAAALWRACAVASPPEERRYLEFFILDRDDWTGALRSALAGGRLPAAEVDGPGGRLRLGDGPPAGRRIWLAEGSAGAVFVAMARSLAARPAALGEAPGALEVAFLWSARRRTDLFALAELEEAAARLGGFRMQPLLDRDPLWRGPRGPLDAAALDALLPAAFGAAPAGPGAQAGFAWRSASYWLAGPPAFRRRLKLALRRRGVGRAAVHEAPLSV